MVKIYHILALILIYASITSSRKKKRSPLEDINAKSNENNLDNNKIMTHRVNNSKNLEYKQKLTVIGYGSEEAPARHLIAFSKKYNLDFHLIGIDKPWTGFNAKIHGFYSFIKSIDNKHNDSIILILDAYDTVPICSEQDLLNKFNSFNADIVLSTGKDCWPDPDIGTFLTNRLTETEKETHKFFPWFLCPNSGAIMGKHDAMLSMYHRLQQLVSIGNGSCNDFKGNKFGKNTQSDQRCYVTFFAEWTKYHEYTELLSNKSAIEEIEKFTKDEMEGIIDINDIKQKEEKLETSFDGSVSKHFIHLHYKELSKHYNGITMKLDYSNDLFLSMSGMMFMDFNYQISNNGKHAEFRSKVTNGSACVLHGNGPGVILWRSFIKQIKNKGNLYVDDYVLRVGVDFFHWMLWWIIMPAEKLSHWLSKTFDVDLGFHSTTFSEEVIWRFHVWTFVAVVTMIGLPLLYWYKYKFTKTMKVNNKMRKIKGDDNEYVINSNSNKSPKSVIRKTKSWLDLSNMNNNSNNSKTIAQQLREGIYNLEVMVQHKGHTFPWPLVKPQKKS